MPHTVQAISRIRISLMSNERPLSSSSVWRNVCIAFCSPLNAMDGFDIILLISFFVWPSHLFQTVLTILFGRQRFWSKAILTMGSVVCVGWVRLLKMQHFSARAPYRPMLLPVRPSVCLSICHGGSVKNGWNRIMKFSPYGMLSPILLVFVGQVSSRNSNLFPRGGVKREGWGNKPFSSFKRQYLETIGDNVQSYY